MNGSAGAGFKPPPPRCCTPSARQVNWPMTCRWCVICHRLPYPAAPPSQQLVHVVLLAYKRTDYTAPACRVWLDGASAVSSARACRSQGWTSFARPLAAGGRRRGIPPNRSCWHPPHAARDVQSQGDRPASWPGAGPDWCGAALQARGTFWRILLWWSGQPGGIRSAFQVQCQEML